MPSSLRVLVVNFVGAVKRLRMSTNKNESSEEAARLAALAELPDPNAELCSQDLTTFTCFPDLPPEIRLMIWRWTFPRGRSIDISQPLPPQPSKRQRFIKNFERDSPYLPTLQVNKESRCLVFEHYFVVFMAGALPFCFNPEIDTAYLPATTAKGIALYQDSTVWLDMLHKCRPDLFENIHTLEICGWYWNGAIQQMVSKIIWEMLNKKDAYGREGTLLNCLPHISNLSTVKFFIGQKTKYSGSDAIEDTLQGTSDMLKCISLVLGLSAIEGAWDDNIPEVEVDWAEIDWDSFVGRYR